MSLVWDIARLLIVACLIAFLVVESLPFVRSASRRDWQRWLAWAVYVFIAGVLIRVLA